MNKEIKLAIYTALIGLVFGWIAHWGFVSIENFRNRPKLSFIIQSLTINEIEMDRWELHIPLYQDNTGNSEGIYSISQCKFHFPLIQSEPITILCNQVYNLEKRNQRIDTLIIPIPNSINDIDIMDFTHFKKIELSISDLLADEQFLCTRDSSELAMHGALIVENSKNLNIRDYMTINSNNGDSILIKGVLNITYNDTIYTNYFLPANAKVKHAFDGDKILIECSDSGEVPFVFFPNNEIKDKFVLPNFARIVGSISENSDQGKVYQNFEFYRKINDGDMYFFIFKNTSL